MQHLNILCSACCYLQYKQCTDKSISIQRVFTACKQFASKPGKALDYIDKWNPKLKAMEGSDEEEQSNAGSAVNQDLTKEVQDSQMKQINTDDREKEISKAPNEVSLSHEKICEDICKTYEEDSVKRFDGVKEELQEISAVLDEIHRKDSANNRIETEEVQSVPEDKINLKAHIE